MIDKSTANIVIESLRKGLPPQRGTRHYAVGHEKLVNGIKNYHLNGIEDKGIIRFISGSWGAGKTHFFRLMREEAFEAGCLVSNVELNKNEAPLNKFEKVFFSIIKQIVTPNCFNGKMVASAAPFGLVLREALVYLSTGSHEPPKDVTFEQIAEATDKLMACDAIDIDFRKIVKAYWDTFLPDGPEASILEQKRDEILQWFSGEGAVGQWKKNYGINKMIGKDNSKLMLQSLSAFIKLSGYKGLVILFDEAEMSFSVMRKSALKDAHNNLLHLINNIDPLTGLFLLYATTPDFYSDPRHGIVTFGALSGRIGKPEENAPRALQEVWNLDALKFSIDQYQEAARKIRAIYEIAYPEGKSSISSESDLDSYVEEIFKIHPALASVRFWRVLMTAVVRRLDNSMEGEEAQTAETYRDVMKELRES
jgi:hypothetical protein